MAFCGMAESWVMACLARAGSSSTSARMPFRALNMEVRVQLRTQVASCPSRLAVSRRRVADLLAAALNEDW